MKKFYPVNYCLNNESDFEDYHPLFNKSANELLLPIGDIVLLLDRCCDDSDNIGISYGGGVTGKWDVLDMHGVDGEFYTLEYLVGSLGTSYFKKGVKKSEVLEAIISLPKDKQDFKGSEFEPKSW
jgi:hypothetical protein